MCPSGIDPYEENKNNYMNGLCKAKNLSTGCSVSIKQTIYYGMVLLLTMILILLYVKL